MAITNPVISRLKNPSAILDIVPLLWQISQKNCHHNTLGVNNHPYPVSRHAKQASQSDPRLYAWDADRQNPQLSVQNFDAELLGFELFDQSLHLLVVNHLPLLSGREIR